MEKRYIITLSSTDKLIAAWKNKALEAKQEKMSTLVKNAILNFIEAGEFLDIGHIHFDPDNVTVKKGEVIPLQTVKTPIINKWIEENRAAGLDVSGPIKLLLKKCIRIVPETEEEYFPPPRSSHKYSETSMLHLMKANAAKISERDSNLVVRPESQPVEIKQDLSSSKPPVTKSTPEVIIQKKSTSESGQVVNGLNSLLPQRASKKV